MFWRYTLEALSTSFVNIIYGRNSWFVGNVGSALRDFDTCIIPEGQITFFLLLLLLINPYTFIVHFHWGNGTYYKCCLFKGLFLPLKAESPVYQYTDTFTVNILSADIEVHLLHNHHELCMVLPLCYLLTSSVNESCAVATASAQFGDWLLRVITC